VARKQQVVGLVPEVAMEYQDKITTSAPSNVLPDGTAQLTCSAATALIAPTVATRVPRKPRSLGLGL
jgi:hypothetical protein